MGSSFSVIFDVALGLVLLYLVLSITASALSESVSNLLQWRAKSLERFITHLLENSGIDIDKFYNDTLLQTQSLDKSGIFPFGSSGKKPQRPAYLRADDFSQAIMDMLRITYPPRIDNVDKMSTTLGIDEWKTMVAQMPEKSALQTVMLAMISRTQRIVATASINTAAQSTTLHDSLSDWYNASMQRVSGWYKARIQVALLIIGIGIAAALNIDTIKITNALLHNPAIRSAVQSAATTAASSADSKIASYINQLNIPIGWEADTLPNPPTPNDWLLKIVGILITGFAVSQGAPFWFDLLNRVANLRSSGNAPSVMPPIVLTTASPAPPAPTPNTTVTLPSPVPPSPVTPVTQPTNLPPTAPSSSQPPAVG